MPGYLTPAMVRVLTALATYHYLMPRQLPRLGIVASVGAAQKLLRRFNHETRLKTVPGRGHLYAPNPKTPSPPSAPGSTATPAASPASTTSPASALSRWRNSGRPIPRRSSTRKGQAPPAGCPPPGAHHRLLDRTRPLRRRGRGGGRVLPSLLPDDRREPHPAGRGDPLRKLTRIDFPPELALRHKKPFFWPDAVFALRTPKKRVLCLLEVYRGIDTARVIRQLEWHLLALEHGLPSLQWGFRTANKVGVVFETETALDAVLKRLLTRPGFEEFAPLVALSTLERLRKDFADWWYVRGGEIRPGALF